MNNWRKFKKKIQEENEVVNDINYGSTIDSNDLADYEIFLYYADEEEKVVEPMLIVQRKQNGIPYIACLDINEDSEIIEKCIYMGEDGSTSKKVKNNFIKEYSKADLMADGTCICSFNAGKQKSYSASDIICELDNIHGLLRGSCTKLGYVDNDDISGSELKNMRYFVYYTDKDKQEISASIINVMPQRSGESYNVYALDESNGQYTYSLLYEGTSSEKAQVVGEFLEKIPRNKYI